MIKICHLISVLDNSGTPQALRRLLIRMDRREFRNSVACLLDEGPTGRELLGSGIPVFPAGMRRGRPSPPGVFRLVRWLRRERPDVLQTWLYHSDLMGILLSRFARKPAVVWNIRSGEMDLSQYKTLFRWVVRSCALLSAIPAAAVVNSIAGRLFHARLGYHPRKWAVIPGGVDTTEFSPDDEAAGKIRQELGLPGDTIVIGLIARLDAAKDHPGFLRAAQLVLEAGARVDFVLVGQGLGPENEALVEPIDSRHRPRIHLLGERTDVPAIMAGLDIAALSSKTEGFPNAVAEAMACGTPCVVTDVGDAADIVGSTGLVVPPGDPLRLAGALRNMISLDRQTRREMGQAARARILERYSLSRVVRAYEELYASLCGGC